MEIGLIGLGKMGGGISKRLSNNGHRVFGYDSNIEFHSVNKNHLIVCNSLDTLVKSFSNKQKNRVIWVMVPSGDSTENTIFTLSTLLEAGDIIIDGGNSYYKDSQKRSKKLKNKKIDLLDVGTSGGIWGEKEGYCLMIGGSKKAYQKCQPIFATLASDKVGEKYIGKSGSGHFVKMIHNGIEYGMMQSIAEGFEIMHSKKEFELNLTEISELWKHGSVVRSWLLDLMGAALKEDPELSTVAPFVEDSGEGRWTIKESIDLDVPAYAITSSLYFRFFSRNDNSFALKALASLRNQFGGHQIKKSN